MGAHRAHRLTNWHRRAVTTRAYGGAVSSDERWEDHDAERAAFEPWHEMWEADPPGQADRHAALHARLGYHVDPTAYVAEGAHVVASSLRIGAHSMIAAGCVIRGDVIIGDYCSLNAGAVTIGKVTIGAHVRVAAYAVLVGENHVFEDLDTPIWLQGMTSEGIVVGDDVWIGANVTVVDGVTIGAHAVVGAGSVVTNDVPEYAVMGGVPARLIRDRRDARRRAQTGLASFDDRVAAQWPDVLERCRYRRSVGEAVEETYVDRPGQDWGPRPVNDAIEIAGAFGATPDVASREELVARLQASQDAATGMFVDPRVGPAKDPIGFNPDREWDMYGVLSVGYALEVLGAGPTHPVHAVENCPADELVARLDALDRRWFAWPAGAWIDAWGTAVHLNRRHHGSDDDASTVFGWLATNQSAMSGLWGEWLEPHGEYDFGWLMAVNGFYRLTRGTYAQFGLDVPRPELCIDTVLAHARQYGWFATRERTACNVLDVVHPLWLLSRQTGHRRAEMRDAVAGVLDSILADWVDGHGFAFAAGADPGLQGTEMWLSIAFLAADLLGESAGLSWRPRGVHRLEPASPLG